MFGLLPLPKNTAVFVFRKWLCYWPKQGLGDRWWIYVFKAILKEWWINVKTVWGVNAKTDVQAYWIMLTKVIWMVKTLQCGKNRNQCQGN